MIHGQAMAALSSSALDRASIALSGVCAIHCLATPIAVIVFPVLSAYVGSDHVFHRLMLTLVVPSSILALTIGCRRHRDAMVVGLGLAGIGLLIGALLEAGPWERAATIAATALIAAAHARNYRLCRRDSCTHQDRTGVGGELP
jgi:hypothetical protein